MPNTYAHKLGSLFSNCLVFLLCMPSAYQSFGQNLVPNGDLEEYAWCPYTWDENGPMVCVPWIGNSNNYFNVCTEWPVGVPETFRGFQYPHAGVGHFGGYQDSQGNIERPYVQLTEPLIGGECYYVSYYVNRADLGCSIDKLGAKLSQTTSFSNSPQIDWQGQFFSDTSGWMHIFGYFVAEGGEEYLMLGNFYNDDVFNADCEEDFPFAYYYFDDIVVELASFGNQYSTELFGPYIACDTVILAPVMPDGTYYTWSDGSHGPRLIVTESGTYSVTVSWQCIEAESTTEVTIIGSPPVVLGQDIELCAGETHMITLDPDAGDYLWQDGSTSYEYTFSSTGLYSVTLNDDDCDLTTDDIFVLVIEPPSAIALGPDTLLCPGQILQFDFDPVVGTYEWQDGSDSPSYTIDAPGIYAVTISNMCGTASDEIEVTYGEPPEFSFGLESEVLCPGESINFNFDDDLGDFLWQDGSTSSSYEITSAGLYSLTISNACGVASDEFVVIEASFPEFEFGGPLSFCPGGELLLQVPDIYGEYEWQDGSPDEEYLVTAPGIYALTITNDCGSYSDFVIVEFASGIEPPNLGPDFSICPGEEVLLIVDQSEGDILWSDLSTDNTLLVNSAGVYFVTLSTVCGSYSDTIQISVSNNAPELNLPEDFTLCEGENAVLNAGVVNVSYLWNDGSQLDSLIASSPGIYSLTITNSCGSDVDSVSITGGGSAPVVLLGPDTAICAGDIIAIIPTYDHVTDWLWPDGSDSAHYLVTMPGYVYVQVSNDCGVAFDTLHVGTFPEIPMFSLGPDTSICNGESIEFSIQIPDVEILWFDGTNNPELIISDSTTVFASITNNCGVSSDTLIVNLLPGIPLLELGPDQTICPGELISISPGIPDVAYLWHDDSTEPEFETSMGGVFHLTISNACGSASDTIEVTESNEGPQLDLGPDLHLCEGDAFIIAPGIHGVNYVWQDGSTDDTFTTSAPGTYHLTIQNACGSDSDTIEITFDGLMPSTSLGPDTSLCIGDTLILLAGYDSTTINLWQDGSTAAAYEVVVSGIYHLTQSNQCGLDSDTIFVEINGTPPGAMLDADTTLCEGNTLTLVSLADDETITEWQDGTSAPTFLVTHAGVFVLTLTNICGEDVDSILVSYQSAPSAFDLGPDLLLCPGDVLWLHAPPLPGLHEWQDGSTAQSFLVEEAGNYSLTIRNECGIANDEITVIYDELYPVIPGQTDLLICDEESIILDVTQSFDAVYTWNTGSSMPTFEATMPGTYTVTVSTTCAEAYEEFVVEHDEECISAVFYVPNVFSPNGDRINDLFELISYKAEILATEGYIFDRWGDLIYSSEINPFSWDGKFEGREVLPGVYVYLIKVRYQVNGREFVRRLAGDVTILR